VRRDEGDQRLPVTARAALMILVRGRCYHLGAGLKLDADHTHQGIKIARRLTSHPMYRLTV
jgi:hypothetical protein